MKISVVGTCSKHLTKALLTGIHNICFVWRSKKNYPRNLQFSSLISPLYICGRIWQKSVLEHAQNVGIYIILHMHKVSFSPLLSTDTFYCIQWFFQLPASVAKLDAPSDWRPGGRGFNPRRGRQHSFVEIDHEIFSTVILSLPLIQEGQLSVSGERMCTILVNRLED